MTAWLPEPDLPEVNTCNVWNLDSLSLHISFTYSNFLLIACNFNLGECRTTISRKPNEHCKILHYETSKSKDFQLLGRAGGETPQTFWPGALPLDQGLWPWTPLGVLPPDLRYRLVLPRSPYLGAPLKFLLAPLGLKFWCRRCMPPCAYDVHFFETYHTFIRVCF